MKLSKVLKEAIKKSLVEVQKSAKEALMHLLMTLMFSDPPQVAIRMGKSLVASDIREGVDVYFNCVIRANPPPKTKIVTWLHNVSIYFLKQTKAPMA